MSVLQLGDWYCSSSALSRSPYWRQECAAERRAALQWALQYFREPTPTTRGSYFVDQRISQVRHNRIVGFHVELVEDNCVDR